MRIFYDNWKCQVRPNPKCYPVSIAAWIGSKFDFSTILDMYINLEKPNVPLLWGILKNRLSNILDELSLPQLSIISEISFNLAGYVCVLNRHVLCKCFHKHKQCKNIELGMPAMPIYDFRCKECGYEFESLVLKNSGPPACPCCSSLSLDRVVSSFSCTTVNLDKRLKMESEDKMRKGQDWMKKQKLRKSRIKIL